MRQHLTTAAIIATALAWGLPAAAAQEDSTIQVASSDQFGEYLTNAEGMALYMFEADTQGKDGSGAVSNCYDDCAAAWPPVIAEGEPKVGEKAQADLIGTIERKDGKQQVTYNGWPLYTFAKDTSAGQTSGQDVEGFGGEWYLVKPTGEVLRAEAGSEGKTEKQG